VKVAYVDNRRQCSSLDFVLFQPLLLYQSLGAVIPNLVGEQSPVQLFTL